jgi:hypothetical protein
MPANLPYIEDESAFDPADLQAMPMALDDVRITVEMDNQTISGADWAGASSEGSRANESRAVARRAVPPC